MMKYFLIVISVFVIMTPNVFGADTIKEKTEVYKSALEIIDPEILEKFPRWLICEPELQIQIRRAFVLAGYDKKLLDENRIEVVAIPKQLPDPDDPEPEAFRLLHIRCGKIGMNSNEISRYLRALEGIISGEDAFLTPGDNVEAKRDYCYEDIPVDVSLTESQKNAILDFFEPTNKTHNMNISLFEQSLKLGESGFWLKNIIGNDQIGYPFWSAGENKVILKRPLYKNTDVQTFRAIPHLMDVYLGIAYNITSGLSNNNILKWVPGRKLNNFPGGKVIGGLDFSLPFHPMAGIHFDIEVPLKTIADQQIKASDYYAYNTGNRMILHRMPPEGVYAYQNLVSPMLRETGRFSLFYNFWFTKENPENFIRVDLGLNYTEIMEMAMYDDTVNTAPVRHIYNDGVIGLKTYKPDEFGDWLYFKAEYRNVASYPFGISFQYSNQILLGRFYVPLVSDWLLLEGKISKTLRGTFPYEDDIFFMVSPVLRLSI